MRIFAAHELAAIIDPAMTTKMTVQVSRDNKEKSAKQFNSKKCVPNPADSIYKQVAVEAKIS